MKIAIILGTRPEIIKMSPIIRECETRNLNYYIIHTGQHYNYEMDQVFFDSLFGTNERYLNLPQPKYNLDVGSSTHANQTGKIMLGIENIFMNDEFGTDVALVQGDTNTVLAGALTASKLQIKIGHVEAGLRSFDRTMPEEINRVVTDHVSDFLFAPTENSSQNLLKEGIEDNKIFVTGNTIVDAVYQNLEISKVKSNIVDKLNLKPKEYFLVTMHRSENVDVKERLQDILNGIQAIGKKFSQPIIFPIHPRTEKMVEKYDLSLDGITVIKPLGLFEFLQLEANAKLILTDSGGVQEEACILGVPCVTLRENTERPETIEVGANMLGFTNGKMIYDCAIDMCELDTQWINPYGDGKSSKRIINIIIDS